MGSDPPEISQINRACNKITRKECPRVASSWKVRTTSSRTRPGQRHETPPSPLQVVAPLPRECSAAGDPAGSPLPTHVGPAPWRPEAPQQGQALKGPEQQVHGLAAETRFSPVGRAHTTPQTSSFESVKDHERLQHWKRGDPGPFHSGRQKVAPYTTQGCS